MPVYEFYCRKCKAPFTEAMSIKEHDARTPQCPSCQEKREVEKRISTVHTVTSKKWLTF